MEAETSEADELILGGGLGAFYEFSKSFILDFHLKYLGGWYRSIDDPEITQSAEGLDMYIGLRARL